MTNVDFGLANTIWQPVM